MFWPRKYYSGLTQKQKEERHKEIKKYGSMSWKTPKAYVGFKTNKLGKHRSSSYTLEWRKLYPDVKSLYDRAHVTGIPLRFLRESYNRGLAAWRTGHRPGATPQQWGYARVSSFALLGKTAHTADADILRRAKTESASARAWFKKMETLHNK